VVRRAYEAFQQGDIQSILDLIGEDIEWNTPEATGVPFGGLRQGKASVVEFFRQLNEAEEVQLFEPIEFIAQGERLAVIGRYRARVKATGRIIELPWIQIFTVRNGKIRRFYELYDTAITERAYQQEARTV